jgi:hypothetical protein
MAHTQCQATKALVADTESFCYDCVWADRDGTSSLTTERKASRAASSSSECEREYFDTFGPRGATLSLTLALERPRLRHSADVIELVI